TVEPSSDQEGLSLDISSRCVWSDPARYPGCLRSSAAWKHGRAHHRAGHQAAGLVVYLRINRDGVLGACELPDLSACAQRRQGNAGEETFAQKHGLGDEDFRTL